MSDPSIGRCLDDVTLARALAGDADDRQRSHLEHCERCAAEANAYRRVIELARRNQPAAASRDRSDQLRTALLAQSALERGPAAPPQRSRRWLLVGAAAAAAVAAAVVLVLATVRTRTTATVTATASDSVRRGTVTPLSDALFHLAGAQPDEIVRLTDGSIHVEVAPLAVGERFRVIAGDGEIEVRGTAFDVTARVDHLVAVYVDHGRVEVRPLEGPKVVLGPGDRWDAPKIAVQPPAPRDAPPPETDALPEPESIERHPATRASGARRDAPPAADLPDPSPAERSPAEQAFADGWDALRRGDASTAASLFEQCLAVEPTGALAEDASYWRGVALSRAGRRAGAIRTLAGFLDAYAGSARAGEASTMLGWLLLEDGDLDGAERRFMAAKDDRSSTVRARATDGLAEVTRLRR